MGAEGYCSGLDQDSVMKNCWAWAVSLERCQGHPQTNLDQVLGSLHRRNQAGLRPQLPGLSQSHVGASLGSGPPS